MPLFHHPLPREGGDPDQGQPAVGAPQVWVPACAGNTDVGLGAGKLSMRNTRIIARRINKASFGAARHFPQRGKYRRSRGRGLDPLP